MVLVDTSVLIDFFRNTQNGGTEKLESLLRNGIPFGINNLIYLEMLQGAYSLKDYELLKNYLDTQIFYELKDGRTSYSSAAEIYRKCRYAGITVSSTVDLLIVQTTIENRLFLLHNDSDYVQIKSVVPELAFY